jgi:hypothetical protein
MLTLPSLPTLLKTYAFTPVPVQKEVLRVRKPS